MYIGKYVISSDGACNPPFYGVAWRIQVIRDVQLQMGPRHIYSGNYLQASHQTKVTVLVLSSTYHHKIIPTLITNHTKIGKWTSNATMF